MEITVEYRDIELVCTFDIDPFVEAVLWGENSHPSEGGVINGLEIFIGDVEISDLLSEKQVDIIKDLIYEQL